jgi:hypothetical protein
MSNDPPYSKTSLPMPLLVQSITACADVPTAATMTPAIIPERFPLLVILFVLLFVDFRGTDCPVLCLG